MARPEAPIPNDAPEPIHNTASKLRAERAKKNITYRDMAVVTNYSPAALSKAASGTVMPSWDIVNAYVKACGGDPDEWKASWEEAKAELDGLNRVKNLPTTTTTRTVGRTAGQFRTVIFDDNHAPVTVTGVTGYSAAAASFHASAAATGEVTRFQMISLVPKADQVTTLEELAAVLVLMAARIGLTGSTSISKRIERQGQQIPRTTISEALSGERMPRLEVVMAISRAGMATEAEADALASAWIRVIETRAMQLHMGTRKKPSFPVYFIRAISDMGGEPPSLVYIMSMAITMIMGVIAAAAIAFIR